MNINKKLFLIIAALALIVVVVIVAYIFRPEKKCVCNDKVHAELDATSLVSSYETDEEQANASYLGKVLTVTGIISSANTNEIGLIAVELDGGSMGMVSCTMCPKETDISLFEEGKTISIKGECVGYTIDVVLIKCCLNN